MRDDDPEAGGVLIGMMMFGMLAALVLLALCGRLVNEFYSIEDSIAATRAYWAAMGMNNYALSRTLGAGLCPGKSGCTGGGADYSAQVKGYVNEVNDMQSWYYLDLGPNYVLQLVPTICQDANAPGAALGEIVIKTAFAGNAGHAPSAPACPKAGKQDPCPAATAPPANTIEALRSVAALAPVELHFCLVGSGATTCGAGPTAGTPGGPQLITSIHRPAC
jgi:hypothetical protein